MRFMMLMYPGPQAEAGVMPDEKLIHAMMKFNEEMVMAGILLAGEGLQPSSKGARVRFGWLGEDALRTWWQGVTAEPAPPKKAPPKRKAVTSQEVVDWSAAARQARSKVGA